MYDLHIHTSHSSDGQYGPGQILAMAGEYELNGIAFADHMDISSVAEGLCLAPSYNLSFYAGVELSTVLHGQEYHLLLYGFSADDEVLKGYIEHHCRAIWNKAHEVLDVFAKMGFDITESDIEGWGHSVPTGVTFLNALIKRNREDRRLQDYLYGNKASSPYLNFYKDYAMTDIGAIVRSALPDLRDAMGLLKGSGLLILAHPGGTGPEVLKRLKEDGLCGIEAYSTHHTIPMALHLVALARDLGLLVSAGSDFHGELIKPGISLGDSSGQPDSELIAILDRMNGR